MELLKKYFQLQKEIYDYFGYVENWVVIPLSDETTSYWFISNNDTVVYSPGPFTKESIEEGDVIYSGVIYTQRFLPKWVYRGEEYTMISVDTQTDGNTFLMVFANDRECKDELLMECYRENW